VTVSHLLIPSEIIKHQSSFTYPYILLHVFITSKETLFGGGYQGYNFSYRPSCPSHHAMEESCFTLCWCTFGGVVDTVWVLGSGLM